LYGTSEISCHDTIVSPTASVTRRGVLWLDDLACCLLITNCVYNAIKVKEDAMLSTLLLIVLILLLIGALPTYPYSRNWGYGSSGGLGLVVVILIIMLLMGRI